MTNLTEYVRSQLLQMSKAIDADADWNEAQMKERQKLDSATGERIERMRAEAAELRAAAGEGDEA